MVTENSMVEMDYFERMRRFQATVNYFREIETILFKH